MPPRKPTPKQDENPEKLILSYLRAQNRPYSATEISSNLHNKVTKTKADKLLKEMWERKEIGGNISGKQCVFWTLQNPNDSATPEELAVLDAAIKTIRESLPGLKAQLKAKTAALAALRSAPTTEALRTSVEELEQQYAEGQARLEVLRSGAIKPVTREEREKTEGELKMWGKKREVRKRIFKDLEALLLEQGEMSRVDLWDKLGLDDDA